MPHVVGVQIREPEYWGSEGQTLVPTRSEIAGTTTTFTPALVDHADGNYTVTYTPSVAGRHIWMGETSDGIPVTFDWDVLTVQQSDPVAALGDNEVTVVSPINAVGDISVIAGDAASIPWSSSGWDDLTGATVTFQAYKLITDTAVFDTPKSVTKTSVGGASQTVTLSLLGTDTDDFAPGIAYRYEVNSTAGTLASGTLSAREG